MSHELEIKDFSIFAKHDYCSGCCCCDCVAICRVSQCNGLCSGSVEKGESPYKIICCTGQKRKKVEVS
jgi:hypothetical protein